jgi:hypothetical protein
MYLIQAWDEDNKRWSDGGNGLLDSVIKTKKAARIAIRELAAGWDCPQSDLRFVEVNNTAELENLTGIKPLIGDTKYEELFDSK